MPHVRLRRDLRRLATEALCCPGFKSRRLIGVLIESFPDLAIMDCHHVLLLGVIHPAFDIGSHGISIDAL